MPRHENHTGSVYPLSSSQREIWFDQVLNPDNPLYNIACYSHIDGPLQPERLEQAVHLVVARHDALRIVLEPPSGDGLPCQRFLDRAEIQLPFHDFSGREKPQEMVLSWMQEQLQIPFPLYGHRLFQFALLRISPSLHYLFKKFHHTIMDGWSVSLIDRSLSEAYHGAGGPVPHGPREIRSYADFIEDDRGYLDSDRFQRDEAYWRERYRDIPEPLFSPRPGRVKAGGAGRSSRKTVYLKRSFYDRLGDYARREKVSLFHVLIGALYTYFTRIGQRDEWVLGLPVLNRSGAAFKKTAGLFTGMIPARFSFGRDLGMGELLRKIAATLRQDYRSQRYPISELNRWVGLHRVGRRQIFDVCLSYMKQDHALPLGDARSMAVMLPNLYSQDPLSIYVEEFHATEDVAVDFDYNLGYFTDDEMEALQARFVCILEAMLEDSDRPIRTFPIMPDRERDLVLSEFNATDAAYPADKTVVDLFEEQAEKSPEAIALVFEEVEMSYGELNARANQLARYLMQGIPEHNPLMAICVERSPETVVGILGILKAGGAYVPLDPAYPKDRLAFMLEDSGVKVLLTQERLCSDLPTSDLGPRTSLCLDRDWAKISECSDANPDHRTLPTDLAYVIYTSGSTGRPKGVMIEHRGLLNYAWWARQNYALDGAHRGSGALAFPLFTSLSFDLTVTSIFVPLISKNRIVIYGEDEGQWEPAIHRVIRDNAVDVIKLTPAHLSLVRALDSRGSKLKRMIIGGEDLKTSLAKAIHHAFGGAVEMVNEYGPTEATVGCTIHRFNPEEDTAPSVPIGRPAGNVKIYILDEYRNLLPVGISGEMVISGDGVARGYLNRADQNTEAFIPSPFIPGERVYRTGDRARWLPDGNLEYLGRMDTQVKLRGFRIEPGEIESTLLEHPQVGEAAVLLIEEEGNPRLAGFVTMKEEGGQLPDPATLPSALREHLKGRLPQYMVPASITLLDAMPLTANGKLDRAALPTPEAPAHTDRLPPRSAVEESLCAAWAEVLGRDGLGISDNFFDLGGDSIKAVQIASRLAARGLRVAAGEILRRQTIVDLAPHVVAAESPTAATPAFPPDGPWGDLPMTAWFRDRNLAEPGHYHQSLLFEARQPLAPERLAAALASLAGHHPGLRLNCDPATGRLFLNPERRGEDFAPLCLAAPAEAELAPLLAVLKAGWDLGRDPLFRAALLETPGRPQRLFLVAHHLLVDLVSWSVLLHDLALANAALDQGLPPELPPAGPSPRAWCETLLRHYQSPAGEREISHWQQALDTDFSLPRDQEPRTWRMADCRSFFHALDPGTSALLLRSARPQYAADPATLVLAALAGALSQWSGRETVLIESEGHGRRLDALAEGPDLSRSLGWYTAMHPLALRLTGSDPAAWAGQVRDQAARTPNQGLGFGVLRHLLGRPELARGPILTPVRYNYLGEVDGLLGNHLFAYCPADTGPDMALDNPMTCELEVIAMVRAGRLCLRLTHHCLAQSRESIRGLAEAMCGLLRAMLASPARGTRTRPAPEDFDAAGLTAEDMEELF